LAFDWASEMAHLHYHVSTPRRRVKILKLTSSNIWIGIFVFEHRFFLEEKVDSAKIEPEIVVSPC
jgi:hypothetical protein